MSTNAAKEELIQAISSQLGEPDPGVIAQIRNMLMVLGPERLAALVRCVVKLESLGGVLIADGSRRRTPGGVLFVLARAAMSREQRGQVWPEYRVPTEEPAGAQPAGSSQSELEDGQRRERGLSEHFNTVYDTTSLPALQQERYHEHATSPT